MRNPYRISLIILYFFVCFSVFSQDTRGILIKDLKGNEGRRWAICIGINDYWDNKMTDLKKARNDAIGLAGIFNTIGQFDAVYTMTDDLDPRDKNYPSKFNIEARIDYIMKMIQDDDLIVFSFSGHGIADNQGKSYLVPADARLEKPFDTSCALDSIVNKLKEKKIKKSLLFIDACREEIQETKSLKAGGFSAPIYSKAELAAIFYATKAGWYSYEDTRSDYGIFTRFLIQGLNGEADNDKDGVVSFSELEKYVMKEVLEYAVELDVEQYPFTKINGEKFGDLALTSTGTGTTIVENKNVPGDMVLVKGGSFEMGTNDLEADEKPVRTVRITRDFLMGKYEVTFDEYDAFCTATGRELPEDEEEWGRGTRPAIYVTWNDAVDYCNWKSKNEGLDPCYSGEWDDIICDFKKNGYRLPTEAEWEYAARGGNKSKGYKFAGSDTLDEVAWYRANSGKKTQPVGKKKPNELGLYDMSGNASEYCWDRYVEGWYNKAATTDPTGPVDDYGRGDRVVRGASWFWEEKYMGVKRRGWGGQHAYTGRTGFRLVRTMTPAV